MIAEVRQSWRELRSVAPSGGLTRARANGPGVPLPLHSGLYSVAPPVLLATTLESVSKVCHPEHREEPVLSLSKESLTASSGALLWRKVRDVSLRST